MKDGTPESRAAGPTAPSDRERLSAVYDTYEADPRYRARWADGPGSRFMLDGKWAAIRSLFGHHGIRSQAALVLVLGAGGGGDCARLRECGIRPENIIAIDLLEGQARRARHAHPWMAALTGDAEYLPFRDECFDLVYQSTMISSVLEGRKRMAIFAEATRVLKHGGLFVSYDVRYPNPWNRQTRPVRAKELRRAFADWPMAVRSLTGIPQIVRVLAPRSIAACRLLERIPPLRSHLLVAARRPEESAPIV